MNQPGEARHVMRPERFEHRMRARFDLLSIIATAGSAPFDSRVDHATFIAGVERATFGTLPLTAGGQQNRDEERPSRGA
jgi:hypothetical protein